MRLKGKALPSPSIDTTKSLSKKQLIFVLGQTLIILQKDDIPRLGKTPFNPLS